MKQKVVYSDEELIQLGDTVHDNLKKSRSEVARYGFGLEDGQIINSGITYCHMGLQNPDELDSSNPPVVITNAVMHERGGAVSKPELLRFMRYLFNDSMYAECFLTKDTARIYEKGYHIRTDKPANLVAGANIASRVPWEWPDVCRSFLMLVDVGVPSNMSFFLAHKYTTKGGGIQRRGQVFHVCINPEFMGVSDVLRFTKGEVIDRKEGKKWRTRSYKSTLGYREIDRMWGDYNEGGRLRIERVRSGSNLTQDPFNLLDKSKEEVSSPLYEAVMSGLKDSGYNMEELR